MTPSFFSLIAAAVLLIALCTTVVIVAMVIAKAAKDARERAMWHEERMAMIEAGIHPDYPPDEMPADQTDPSLHETTGHPEG